MVLVDGSVEHAEYAPLPWFTVKVVPDEPVPLYCVRCGASTWVEGGPLAPECNRPGPCAVAPRPAAQHLVDCGPFPCPMQRLLWASPPYGPNCTLAAGHAGNCVFPETWLDPATGKTIDVATHGRVQRLEGDLADVLKTRIGEATP